MQIRAPSHDPERFSGWTDKRTQHKSLDTADEPIVFGQRRAICSPDSSNAIGVLLTMPDHHKIDYVEFPCNDFRSSKDFFAQVFGWKFTDYGPGYSAFSGAGLEGGFYAGDLVSRADSGAALVVLFSDDLEATQRQVERAGGSIVKQIFSFPGGRRFHFLEPSGNELAVWSDK